MKKIICISLPVLIILLVFSALLFSEIDPSSIFAKTEFAHLISLFKNMNRFEIKSKNVYINEITILWNNNIIFCNGHFIQEEANKSYYEYGGNSFIVKLNDKIISEYVQIKFNNWHFHHYKFLISNTDGIISCNFSIVGPDEHFNIIHASENQ